MFTNLTHFTSSIAHRLRFLLGVAILGFGALFVTFLALATTLVGLVPAVFRKVAILRAHMTDSILREHTQILADVPDYGVLAMAAVRISASINLYIRALVSSESGVCAKRIRQMVKHDSQLDCI